MELLALSINDTAKALGIGRSSVYALLKSGRLDAIKIGRRTLLTTESVRRLAQTRHPPDPQTLHGPSLIDGRAAPRLRHPQPR